MLCIVCQLNIETAQPVGVRALELDDLTIEQIQYDRGNQYCPARNVQYCPARNVGHGPYWLRHTRVQTSYADPLQPALACLCAY
jgi:hypothetical protein